MPFSVTNCFVFAIASFTLSPLSEKPSNVSLPAAGELQTMPSLASKLSSDTSAPSMSGVIGRLKCLAKA